MSTQKENASHVENAAKMEKNPPDNALITSERDLKREDEALVTLAKHGQDALPTAKEITSVKWRIDLFLMPLMIIVYMLQFLDKVTYGLSANFGALQDLQLETINSSGVADLARFQNGAMIFWTGYIAGLFPLSFMAQKLPVSVACSITVVLWGIVFIVAPTCHSWQGIYIQRFFLGFLESGVTPCFMLLTGMFYTKAEQASRSAIWFAGCNLSQIIGYPIMYALTGRTMPFPIWHSLYYLWGSATIFFGIVFFFLVPSSPTTAMFLSERQKYVAVERLRSNQAGLASKRIQTSQIIEAFTDIKVLLMIPLAFLTVIPNACVSTFSPIVLRSLGYTGRRSLLLTIPQGATSVPWILLLGYIQQRWRNLRAVCFTITIVIIIICAALLWRLPQSNTSGRLAAVSMFPSKFFCPILWTHIRPNLNAVFTSAFITILAQTVSNVSGHTKRSVANAIFLIGYGTGQAVAPLTYPSDESATGFPTGFKATVICLVLAVVLMWIYTGLSWLENRRRNRLGAIAQEDRAFHDLTDKQNLSFRYEL